MEVNHKRMFKTTGIVMLILIFSVVVHEAVHVYQCYADPNVEFEGIYITITHIYVCHKGKMVIGELESETQAYIVQILFIFIASGIYLLKKDASYNELEWETKKKGNWI